MGASEHSNEESCHYHTGDLEPAGPEKNDISRRDKQLIAKSARQALRASGGAASRRAGSHGHWSKGLGLPATIGSKTMIWEPGCLEPGELSCEWSCCKRIGIFAPGCALGPHRSS